MFLKLKPTQFGDVKNFPGGRNKYYEFLKQREQLKKAAALATVGNKTGDNHDINRTRN